jgi:hypothetical protein
LGLYRRLRRLLLHSLLLGLHLHGLLLSLLLLLYSGYNDICAGIMLLFHHLPVKQKCV